MIIQETLPLALAQPILPSDEGPSVRVTVRPRAVRLRRERSGSSGRRWLLEIEIELRAIDPERLLAECEGFLVEGSDGRQIGVVEEIETAGTTRIATALLVSAGWFGRRRLRIDAQAVEALEPGERRVIVDESLATSTRDGSSSA